MKKLFTANERRAIQRLAGLPRRLSRWSRSRLTAVPIAELRRALDLPPLRYSELVRDDRWLAGGAVLRWLCRGLGSGAASRGDFDYFVPSLEVLNRTGKEFLDAGFRFRCFRSARSFCPRCGDAAELAAGETVRPGDYGRQRVACLRCGETGAGEARELAASELLALTPEIVAARRVMALELETPEGDQVHVSARALAPSPRVAIARFDFSITQFAVDRERLYFSPWAFPDLLQGRTRLTADATPLVSRLRMRKYAELGFEPYLGTVLRLHSFRWTRIHQRRRPLWPILDAREAA